MRRRARHPLLVAFALLAVVWVLALYLAMPAINLVRAPFVRLARALRRREAM